MVEIIPLVLNNQIKSISMKELVDKGYKHRYFNKKSILDYKEINNSDFETRDILYKIRAFDFPGYEPAYYKFNGKKIYKNHFNCICNYSFLNNCFFNTIEILCIKTY